MDILKKYKALIRHEKDDVKDSLADFLRKSAMASSPVIRSKEAIWDRIEEAIDKEEGERNKVLPFWRYTGIAASITILVMFSVLFFQKTGGSGSPEEIRLLVPLGETKVEVLPDGSQVTLNAVSSLTYLEDEVRRVSLDGEAFFKIEEGKSFTISTHLGDVVVLGTSFNVFARNDKFEVSCKTGRVKVIIPSKSLENTLVPGEMVSMDVDTVRLIERSPDLIGKWQLGEFYFENQPIEEVFKELQRQFNIRVEFEEEFDQSFSGYFTNRSLEKALDMVCLPLGLEHQKTGSNVFSIKESSH